MSLIVTPGQLSRRAELYHQLAQLTEAGLTLPSALEQLRRNPPAHSFREPLRRLIDELARGYTFSEAVTRLGHWLPSFDIALLSAAEQSGRLDAVFELLSVYYGDRARLMRQVIGDLAYPAFLFHFAVFIIPFPRFILSGSLTSYLSQTLGVLLPVYLVLLIATYAAQGCHGECWRSTLERLLGMVPLVGTARRQLALARLAAALEALISAGVTIIEAWELAVAASGSPALRRAVKSWKPQLDGGQTPGELIQQTPRFPELFANLYNTGEVSGKLDETLRRLHRLYQEEGTRKLHLVAQWTPRLVYLLVMLMIAIQIIQFWTSYFQQVRDAGGF